MIVSFCADRYSSSHSIMRNVEVVGRFVEDRRQWPVCNWASTRACASATLLPLAAAQAVHRFIQVVDIQLTQYPANRTFQNQALRSSSLGNQWPKQLMIIRAAFQEIFIIAHRLHNGMGHPEYISRMVWFRLNSCSCSSRMIRASLICTQTLPSSGWSSPAMIFRRWFAGTVTGNQGNFIAFLYEMWYPGRGPDTEWFTDMFHRRIMHGAKITPNDEWRVKEYARLKARIFITVCVTNTCA